MDVPEGGALPDRAATSAYSIKDAISASNRVRTGAITPKPETSPSRLAASLDDKPCDVSTFVQHPTSKTGTVLYLAYGSNLSNKTFRGKRGIVPLSQINVQVPSLRLTFDLPGVPYVEPCFANTGIRNPEQSANATHAAEVTSEKSPLLGADVAEGGYRKDAWRKGLVGVVYEVTPEDYAHVIATEGGGSSYQDILVDCYPFASDDPRTPVPDVPRTQPFKAHTLFAPALPPGSEPPKEGGRLQRPDTSYAQASARYLKLLSDGAAERNLPYEYQEFLLSLRPYRITTYKQRIGQGVFVALWIPLLLGFLQLSKVLAGKDGKVPPWMRQVTAALFKGLWSSYDRSFKPLFGDGERTIGDEKDADHGRANSVLTLQESIRNSDDIEKNALDLSAVR